MSDNRTVAITVAAAVVIAGGMSAVFASRLGVSLEFWLLGLVTVTVCIPPLVMQVRERPRTGYPEAYSPKDLAFAREQDPSRSTAQDDAGGARDRSGIVREGIVVSCASDTVAVAWLVATIISEVTLMQWLSAYLLLCAYSLALWGAVRLLARFIDSMFASAITMTVALAWLTCPMWLSHARVTGYIPVHPVFALNSAVKMLGIWTERGIAYTTLTNLGQDVPYTLPETIWGALALHAILGGACLAAASTRRRRAIEPHPSSPVELSKRESPP